MIQGANDFNMAMTYAALYGHLDIVLLMLQQGTNSYNEVLSKAAREGHQKHSRTNARERR